MNCEQCEAKCCKNIFIQPKFKITEDIKKWLEFHGLEVKRIRHDFIKINNPCSKLVDNKCSIYEDRPQNCRDYKCEDNKDFL